MKKWVKWWLVTWAILAFFSFCSSLYFEIYSEGLVFSIGNIILSLISAVGLMFFFSIPFLIVYYLVMKK
ncbi:MAG: hypothetical protein ABIJ18_01315 [archaeon]